ncbi:MAG TPA: D-alanyl-D-alanine carboxypeptidase [Flavisolibacter sp.]|nr:D-alanyl-D-alanine carboxypeptidase [Flavisolibacter sp.]
MKTKLLVLVIGIAAIVSCSPARKIGQWARRDVINDSALRSAHVGISVYDPATASFLYNYQGDKYFVPASNTKLPGCYAAMKYLGDSLPGLRYEQRGNELYIAPTGDPTFLHPEFATQRVYDLLKSTDLKINLSLLSWKDERWGSGWSWNDYSESYMPERSALPVYGNVVRFSGNNGLQVVPSFFKKDVVIKDPASNSSTAVNVNRDIASNRFVIEGQVQGRPVETPYFTDNGQLAVELLTDTLHKQVYLVNEAMTPNRIMYSQPTDSMLKPMMHRSDNFFAEQSLMMVGQKLLGEMNDARIINRLLDTDLKDLPQKPHWVDGSGLSRYNLFTPQDMVTILNKMRLEFGIERMKEILPTGNEGTLTNYYKNETGYVFAKTGTLSGVVAFSGYLFTKKNKLLIVSVLVNNHQASATAVRRAVEKFVEQLREKN